MAKKGIQLNDNLIIYDDTLHLVTRNNDGSLELMKADTKEVIARMFSNGVINWLVLPAENVMAKDKNGGFRIDLSPHPEGTPAEK